MSERAGAAAWRPWARRALTAVGVALVLTWVFKASFSFLGTANLALTYTLVAISLVVLTGWVGQISLAQAAFVGLGAFSTALLVNSFGFAFPATLIVAAGVASAAAALLGLVALRVRGLYLAVATLIFAWMVQGYLFNQPWLAGTGGAASAGIEPLGNEGGWPFFDFTDRRTFYFFMLAAVAAALFTASNLRDSKTGRAFFAVRGSEVAAASLGIDVTRAKLVAFAFSGFLAGAAGSMTMTHQQVASASSFAVETSLFYLAVAVVGGLTSLPGAVASGILFASLEEVFFRVETLSGFLLIVSASLLAIVLLFFPAGLAGIPGRLRALAATAWHSTARRRAFAAVGGLVTRRRRADDLPAEAELVEQPAAGEGRGAQEEVAPSEEPPSEKPVEPIVVGGIAALFYRLGRGVVKAMRSVRPTLGARRPTAQREAPDMLTTSIEEAAAAAQPEEASIPGGLTYVPGTSTKVKLPARHKREVMLAARDITVQFGGLRAVDSFDLEVRRGEIVGLIGPNGAGKTTLFNAVSGLNQPTTGSVEFDGVDVTGLPVHERARLGMGRTFQAIQLFSQLSVFDNLMVATHFRNPTGFFSHLAATRNSVEWEGYSRERVRQVLALTGLEDVADREIGGLPFGVLRLVELARALVTGTPFVMLDEPASGLDNAETDAFMDLLLWARQSLGVTMLLIEHDVRVVTSLSDWIYVIDRGKPVANGTPAKIQRDPAVIAAYLGTAAAAEPDEPEGSDEPAEVTPGNGGPAAGKQKRSTVGARR